MNRVLRILLAEDNPGDVYLVQEALHRNGVSHELTLAKDGTSAWNLIDACEASPELSFDIILLDLNLPVRCGLEVLERIRRCRGPLARALVVVVTSSDSPRDRAAANRGKADYYFRKPSDLEQFLELGSIVQELWARRTRGNQ